MHVEDRDRIEAERAESGDDVEGHKLEAGEERERAESGDDVEGHAFKSDSEGRAEAGD